MSIRLAARLQQRLSPTPDLGVQSLLRTMRSPNRFDSQDTLQSHLVEGSLLNVTKLASDCLSIPSGKYVVWLTDSGRTVLVPATQPSGDVHRTKLEDQYELHTARLLGAWNKLERTIAEDLDSEQQASSSANHFNAPPEAAVDEPYTFGRSVTRTSLWSAMTQAGMGVGDLADAVGVDKSTVSRLLRDVENGPGDPKGRNPSVALAQKIAQVLGVDVGEVLPPPEDVKLHKREKTGGSGRGGMRSQGARGNDAFSSGNTQESHLQAIAGLLVETKLDPTRYLTERLIALPNSDAVVNEFLANEFRSSAPPMPGVGADTAKLFERATASVKALQQAFSKQKFTARFGEHKFSLNEWLGGVVSSLQKIQQKMPQVLDRKRQEKDDSANTAYASKLQAGRNKGNKQTYQPSSPNPGEYGLADESRRATSKTTLSEFNQIAGPPRDAYQAPPEIRHPNSSWEPWNQYDAPREKVPCECMESDAHEAQDCPRCGGWGERWETPEEYQARVDNTEFGSQYTDREMHGQP